MRLKRNDNYTYIFRKLNYQFEGYFMSSRYKGYSINSIDIGYVEFNYLKTFYI